jgi:cytochrome c551/c552
MKRSASTYLALTLTAASAAALLASCSKPASQAAAPAEAKYDTSLDMKEIMGHLVDPGSWAFWHASGTVTSKDGDKSLLPTTEEGWEAAESGAVEVMQAGNILQLPGYSRGPEFNAFAQDLTAKAKLAKAAAEAKDGKAMFTTGADLYQVCVACHAKYVMPAYIAIRDKTKYPPLPDWPADVKAAQTKFAAGAKK